MKIRTYVCAVCGADGQQVGRGPTRKRCLACTRETDRERARNREYKPDTPCAVCGKVCFRGRGSLPAGQLTCQECRGSRPKPKRVFSRDRFGMKECEGCSRSYPPSHHQQRWCSLACANTHKALRRFTPEEARERIRESWRQKNRRRRAAKRGGASEPYTLAEIAERDRLRCGLCRGRVAMKQKVPHPKAPTIDHVVPLLDGGDDTRANVQLAHFHCNSVKGPRGSQQLALIG
jgi:hypothetical protein